MNIKTEAFSSDHLGADLAKKELGSKRPCVCMILPRKLFPLVSGYSLKNYYLIRLLNEHYRLHLVVISSEELSEDEIAFYETHAEQYQIWRMTKAERLVGTLGAFFCGLPIQVGLYQSRKLWKWLEQEEAETAEVMIGELVRTMPYETAFGGSTVKVFDMVDSIGLNYTRSLEKTRSLFWKCYYRFEAKRLLRYEEACIKRADVSLLFNQEEQAYWNHAGNTRWLPHGVKEELLTYPSGEMDADAPFVAFIGKMNYQPNVDAVCWYAKNVHSQLKQPLQFVIVGAYPSAEVLKLQERYEHITVTGFVDDPYEILSRAVAVIAPMQTGGGIQNKVLEAMAIGKVNLLSEKAAKPITGAKDGEHFLICDTCADYERNLTRLLNDPKERTRIEANAKAFIHAHYTWEKYGEQYVAALEQCRKKQKRKCKL